MTLLQDIETVKEDITGVLQVGSEQVPLSQKELLLFGILRLILGGIGGVGGGEGGSVTIDNAALAGAIANALELKTLTVSGDTVNETALAAAIASNTQPISASSLPLPTDAATETTLLGVVAKLPSALVGDRLKVDNSGVTQPVSAASLPLPTGATTETTLLGILSKLPSALVSDRFKVDNSGVTQPVSAASLPLPTGAATETTLSGLSAKLPSVLVSGRLSVDGSAVTQPISAATLPLPAGAATSAKQPGLGAAGSPSADVISIQGVANGTPLPTSQVSNATTASVTFTSSTTSSTFTITNRLALIQVPAITGAPLLTLQVTLNGGTTWVNTSVTLATDATNARVIESDSLARVSGAFGLANAFRFGSSASITAATLSVRSIVL